MRKKKKNPKVLLAEQPTDHMHITSPLERTHMSVVVLMALLATCGAGKQQRR